MTKKRKPEELNQEPDLIDEGWFDEVDPDKDGEYWNPGRRVAQPRLSDEEPDQC